MKVVPNLDLERFQGTWYEIAHNPWFPEKDCYSMVAHYKITNNENINVTNVCRKNSFDGKIRKVSGIAWMVEEKNKSKWEVQFIWPFTLDYWVIGLGENYDYAIIGEPDKENLWVLSREPFMDEKLLSNIIEDIKTKGYDLSNLILTPHDSTNSKCLAQWIESGMNEKIDSQIC